MFEVRSDFKKKFTLRACEAGPYLGVADRHWDVGNRLSDRLGLVGKPGKV